MGDMWEDQWASWREIITRALRKQDETWDDVVSCTLTDEELDVVFYVGFWSTKGLPFTVWTENRVYFPAVYDGFQWCESVPRNPCEEKTSHVGDE